MKAIGDPKFAKGDSVILFARQWGNQRANSPAEVLSVDALRTGGQPMYKLRVFDMVTGKWATCMYQESALTQATEALVGELTAAYLRMVEKLNGTVTKARQKVFTIAAE